MSGFRIEGNTSGNVAEVTVTNELKVSATTVALPTGASTETTLASRLADATFTGRINTLGAKTSAASTPVVLASDQATLPISAVSLPLPTGATTSALQTAANATLTAIAANTGASSVDFTNTGTIVAPAGNVVITGQGVYTVSALVTGIWVGTLVFEGQLADAGGTWVQIPAYVITTSLPYAQTFSTTANGTFIITGGGYLNIRVRASALASGTASIALDGSLSQQTVFSAQLGQWSLVHNGVATYSAATAAFTPAAAATDIFIIQGSATKTIKILRVIFSGVQTTASNIATVSLIKRSTANTVGTAISTTKVPNDSAVAASTATVQHYTANPTVGSAVGTIYNPRVLVPGTTTVIAPVTIMDFDSRAVMAGQTIVLRGAAEGLALNLGGVTPVGSATFQITAVWTEE